jgi:hypothetical protein
MKNFTIQLRGTFITKDIQANNIQEARIIANEWIKSINNYGKKLSFKIQSNN